MVTFHDPDLFGASAIAGRCPESTVAPVSWILSPVEDFRLAADFIVEAIERKRGHTLVPLLVDGGVLATPTHAAEVMAAAH